jgi:hypothetical protein
LRHNAVFISATNWAAVFYDRFDLSLQAFHEDYRDTSKPLKAFICVIKDGARQKKLMPKVDCCATARFLRRCQNCYGFMVALIFCYKRFLKISELPKGYLKLLFVSWKTFKNKSLSAEGYLLRFKAALSLDSKWSADLCDKLVCCSAG